GCPSDTSAAFTIQIDTAITIGIITNTVVCQGDSITLQVSPEGTGSYSWSGPGGFNSNEETPTVLAANGSYSVTFMSNTGCVASASTDVQVNAIPVILSLETDADSCVNGTTPVTIWAVTNPGFSSSFDYVWEGNPIFTEQDSAIVFQNATSAINGDYTLVVVNGTCFSTGVTIELNVSDQPATPVITGSNTYCTGDSIILSIDSPIINGEYSWTSNDTSVVIPSPGTLVIPNATAGFTGLYHVSFTVNGCTSGIANYGVQVRPALPPAVISSTAFVCEGDSLALTSNAPANAVLSWTGPNGFSSSVGSPVIFPATTLNAGVYVLNYELNGCPAPVSAPFNVQVQSALATPAISGDVTSLCLDAPVPVTICIDPNSLTP
ncbi:MAG TPA: hypothetical protein VJ508_18050, partial [Saprospiraceae bacterium]|nr:hypothetical protein [Saprospiraceae bacterium]